MDYSEVLSSSSSLDSNISSTNNERKRKVIDEDGTDMKRYCEVVFKSQEALNGHRCDFSCDKFPVIEKSMCTRAMAIHKETYGSLDVPQDFSIRKQEPSETSYDDAKHEDFFAYLHLQNKSTPQSASLNITETESKKSLSRNDITPESGEFLKKLDKEEAQDEFKAEFRKMKLYGEFPCNLCMAVFPNLRALKGHNKIHLSSAESGPFRCNICPFYNYDKTYLNKHMTTHNGDRPFKCSLCNQAFTTKANCKRHLHKRHGRTTKNEVKPLIIYHPCEASSCDEHAVNKMQVYNSSFYDEEVISKDRSSPVTNLKKMFVADTVKIQEDQLIKRNIEETEREKEGATSAAHQQQFPKIDPAHYFQLSQIFGNLVFPTDVAGFSLHPLLLQHLFVTYNNDLKDIYPENWLGPPIFQPGLMDSQIFPPPPGSAANISSHPPTEEHVNHVKSPHIPNYSPQNQQLLFSTQQNNLNPNSGPVKMTVKNDVLVAKHKQRRFRTVRPFACRHCSKRFTLRSNMERHIRLKHNNSVLKPEEQPSRSSSDLPFKCHLCDGSFSEALACLEHIKNLHTQDFSLFMDKVRNLY